MRSLRTNQSQRFNEARSNEKKLGSILAMRFQNKAVIVTGGSKGIGEGCCRVFCGEGGLVAILARGKEAGEALASELNRKGPGRAIYLPCDVARLDQLQSAIDRTAKEFGS